MTVVPGPGHNTRTKIDAFQPFSPLDWHGAKVPPCDWMVENCFLRGTVAMMSGDGGLGKSLLMQQLMTAAAVGRPWLGMATTPCKSLGIFCEDDRDELHRRQHRINQYYGCQMDQLEGMLMDSRPGRDSILVKFGRWGDQWEATAFLDQLRYQAREHGAEIIVLDTRRDIFSGNEIDYIQARLTISILRRLAIEIQGTVILTDHPSNEGLSSGSGISGNRAWNNSVRSRLYLTAAEPPKGVSDEEKKRARNARVLRTAKANSGPYGGEIPLRWQNGVFVVDEPPAPRDWTEPRLDDDWPQ